MCKSIIGHEDFWFGVQRSPAKSRNNINEKNSFFVRESKRRPLVHACANRRRVLLRFKSFPDSLHSPGRKPITRPRVAAAHGAIEKFRVNCLARHEQIAAPQRGAAWSPSLPYCALSIHFCSIELDCFKVKWEVPIDRAAQIPVLVAGVKQKCLVLILHLFISPYEISLEIYLQCFVFVLWPWRKG